MRGALRFSEWLYAALLSLYPRRFRASFGQPMRQTFRAACRYAYRHHGALGLLALWLPTLLDLVKSALEQQTRQGELTMSQARLIALAGPLTLLVGALWLLSALGTLAFQLGLFQDEGLVGVVTLPFFLSFIPLLFALLGTRLRFHPSARSLGRLGLALSAAGGAGVIIAVLASIVFGGVAPEAARGFWVNYAAVVFVLSLRLGYFLFGLEAQRRRLLPRWNWLPLLLGLTLVLSLPMDWFGVPAFLPTQWANPFLHFALTGACWVLLGLVLRDPRRQPQPTPAP